MLSVDTTSSLPLLSWMAKVVPTPQDPLIHKIMVLGKRGSIWPFTIPFSTQSPMFHGQIYSIPKLEKRCNLKTCGIYPGQFPLGGRARPEAWHGRTFIFVMVFHRLIRLEKTPNLFSTLTMCNKEKTIADHEPREKNENCASGDSCNHIPMSQRGKTWGMKLKMLSKANVSKKIVQYGYRVHSAKRNKETKRFKEERERHSENHKAPKIAILTGHLSSSRVQITRECPIQPWFLVV